MASTASAAATTITKINYVAMGDSYSSGEGLAFGAPGYITNNGYNSNLDGCHRASNAFPELVAKSFGSSLGSFDFDACSGDSTGSPQAVVRAFGGGGNLIAGGDGEAPQISARSLTASVNDISLTVGASDAGLADVAEACTSLLLQTGAATSVVGIPTSITGLKGGGCASELALSDGLIGDGTATSKLAQGLIATYETILTDAPQARLAVFTYPQLLNPTPIGDAAFCPLAVGMHVGSTATATLGFSGSAQSQIDAMEATINQDISSAVTAVAGMGAYDGRIMTVDMSAATSASAQPCAAQSLAPSDIKGIHLAPGTSVSHVVQCFTRKAAAPSCHNLFAPGTLDPTESGHVLIAQAAENAFSKSWGSTTPPPLASVSSVVSDRSGKCALLTSGGVDCWGFGQLGELGDGEFYTSGSYGSAFPVPVVSTSGTGTLSGVASVIGGNLSGYCALLTSGGVDCWGFGQEGELGDGQLGSSAIPVPVISTTGESPLEGVTSLVSNGGNDYCALLTSGGVDCWGFGQDGELGDGQSYTSGFDGSPFPVPVVSTSGAGALGGVSALVANGDGYCALLTSGGVDCWGYGYNGELGNGQFYTSVDYGSAVPVPVVGPTGTGTLEGVSQVLANDDGYCALLSTRSVDCWGFGQFGEIGDGQMLSTATPTPVVSTSGSGVLGGVSSIAADGDGYCALLTSGGVDCWGYGYDGELGNGQFYTGGDAGSAVPVSVVSAAGNGALSGVVSLIGDAGYCALLTSGGVDCWGSGQYGELGDGQTMSSAIPVSVESTSGSGALGGVSGLIANDHDYCALLTAGGVDCWGYGYDGELGNGQFYTSGNEGSAAPVAVESP